MKIRILKFEKHCKFEKSLISMVIAHARLSEFQCKKLICFYVFVMLEKKDMRDKITCFF